MIALPGPHKGLRIGLFGGSFNPAHSGHRHVADTALKTLGLDWVWWLVARGNPLKSDHGDYAARLASARQMALHPRMRVSDLEMQAGLTYSVDTLGYLRTRCPSAKFVWLMGGDNLESFTKWRNWQTMSATTPIAIIARPGTRLSGSAFTLQLAPYRRPANRQFPSQPSPAWCYIRAPLNMLSSTEIRSKMA